MAKKKFFLHIGRAASTATQQSLLDHRALFAGAGVAVPAAAAEDLEAAAMEMLRSHAQHGIRRCDVEGAWAELTRDLWRGPTDAVLTLPSLHAADADQAALVIDHLAGLAVHVIVTSPTDAPDDALVNRWARLVKPGALHVVDLDDDADALDLAEALTGVALVVARRSAVRPTARLRRPRRHHQPHRTDAAFAPA